MIGASSSTVTIAPIRRRAGCRDVDVCMDRFLLVVAVRVMQRLEASYEIWMSRTSIVGLILRRACLYLQAETEGSACTAREAISCGAGARECEILTTDRPVPPRPANVF